MQIKNLFNPKNYTDFLRRVLTDDARLCYSQAGEDMLIRFAARSLRIQDFSYLDIGAYDPIKLSNTYSFYRNGSNGVLVEPNPEHAKKIRQVRPRDLCVEAGVGLTAQTEATYYLMSDSALNTFSKKSAGEYVTLGQTLLGTKKIPLYKLEYIIDNYCTKVPDLISLDIEGMDEEILGQFDFTKYRPAIFVVETMTLDEQQKNTNISALFEKNGYFVFADTYVNTIFVEKERWEAKKHERIIKANH